MLKYITFIYTLLSSTVFAQSWQQINDFPSSERDDGISFEIGNTSYCGTGLTPWFSATNDLYALDMNSDIWRSVSSLPIGAERQYASGFSSSNAGLLAVPQDPS